MKIKKIAIYARVSTNNEDQKNSIENQKKFFMDYIKEHDNWELYKIYADEGISGTSLKKRVKFNNMMYDAECGKFDIILTKEVCRFARNTVDTLEKTRDLKKLGIEVRFLIDNISTFDKDGELRLTILGGIAQDESRRLSERTNFGIQQEMKNGKVFGSAVYGYKIIDRKLIINPQEAKIVRKIFDLYLNKNWGYYKIAKELTNQKIPLKRQRDKSKISYEWYAKTIKGILTNEKYIGNLIQGKTYTENFLLHKRKENKGEKELYIFENNHEAIIEKEIFDMVQDRINQKSKIYKKNNKDNKSLFSGKIKCGICGSNYYCAIRAKRNNNTTRCLWKCRKNLFYGKKTTEDEIGCNGAVVSEFAIKEAFKIALTRANLKNNKLNDNITDRIKNMIIRENDNVLETKSMLNNQKEKLLEEKKKYLDLYLNDIILTSLYMEKNFEIDSKINIINEKLKNALSDDEKNEKINTMINRVVFKMNKFISNNGDIDANLSDKILEKIIVYDRRNVYVYLRGFDEPFHINNLNELDDLNKSYTWLVDERKSNKK